MGTWAGKPHRVKKFHVATGKTSRSRSRTSRDMLGYRKKR